MREAAKIGESLPAATARAPGRAFLESALAERSAPALAAAFRAAIAAEGMTRHLCARHDGDGRVELLACDYPFDPGAVAELGRLRFEIDNGLGETIGVIIAGGKPRPDAGRHARLHGYAMLYAACLPALLASERSQPRMQTAQKVVAEQRGLLNNLR